MWKIIVCMACVLCGCANTPIEEYQNYSIFKNLSSEKCLTICKENV